MVSQHFQGNVNHTILLSVRPSLPHLLRRLRTDGIQSWQEQVPLPNLGRPHQNFLDQPMWESGGNPIGKALVQCNSTLNPCPLEWPRVHHLKSGFSKNSWGEAPQTPLIQGDHMSLGWYLWEVHLSYLCTLGGYKNLQSPRSRYAKVSLLPILITWSLCNYMLIRRVCWLLRCAYLWMYTVL